LPAFLSRGNPTQPGSLLEHLGDIVVQPSDSFDLIIVGAGLTGATLACAVAQLPHASSLSIALIEADMNITRYEGESFDPRVVALTQASQNLLQRIGVWDAIYQARACAYTDMHVWDGEGTADIHFNASDVRAANLGYIVENSVALAALRQQLKQHKNIQVIQPVRVTQLEGLPSPRLHLDNGLVISAPLIIAADGAKSRVRELAPFDTREWDYHQMAIVTTVQTEFSHQATAWQRFMRTGPLAFLPLPSVGGKHFCSIVWSLDRDCVDDIMQLSDGDFCARLGRAFEYKLGAILHSAERFAIPLRQRHAKEYCVPGIALVGDAAHNIHPLAGQGVNLGLLDVNALVIEIERALQRKIPLGDFSILRRYQRQRLASNLGMMSAMEAFKRLFGSDSLAITWLRNTGMRQLNSLTALKKIIVRSAMGLH
jgi:2-polyprenylphenol 6-hydroxylase